MFIQHHVIFMVNDAQSRCLDRAMDPGYGSRVNPKWSDGSSFDNLDTFKLLDAPRFEKVQFLAESGGDRATLHDDPGRSRGQEESNS